MKKYTYSAKNSENQDKWFIVDAKDQILGRLATLVASRIRGKHNPSYTPHADTGDSIIVINADKIKLTGRKMAQKFYHRHSGYVGGLTSISAEKLLEKRPEDVFTLAVKGMLPKNRLGSRLNKKLHVYAGDTHPHAAQKPEVLDVN